MNNNSVEVNINEFITKIKNRKILIEFFFKIGYYFPNLSSYSHDFAIQVASGKKNVIFSI